jgi:Dehydrogenases with different specificities (related to short-chain alcohol dehydrogenases)
LYKFDFTGKVALITGGAKGLGKEYVQTFAEQGADVALFDANLKIAQETAKEIEELTGKKIRAYQCDVGNEKEVIECVAAVVKEFGKIDQVVNNAGILRYGDALADWEKVVNVNLTGPFLVNREVVKQSMMIQKKGRIVNVSSIGGVLATPAGVQSYHASKAGVIAMTKAQAGEWAPYNILVNSVAPGAIANGTMGDSAGSSTAADDYQAKSRNPMKRRGQFGEMSGIIIYFCSDENTYTNGQFILVDGGWAGMM